MLRRAPVIYDAHDFYSGLDDTGAHPAWQRRLERRIERRCIRRAALAVTVSEGVADLYEARFGIRPDVLPNAHDPRLDRIPATTVRAALGLGDAAFLVVLVGQWKTSATPVDQVVQAVALAHERVHAVFVGDGFPEDCADAATRAGVGDRVHFLPAVDSSEVVPFVATADAGAILYRPTNASVAACLPNGLYQVIAAGLPVVFALDLPMVAAIADDVGLGVEADDPVTVARAFDRLADDDRLRAQLREGATSRSDELAWSGEEARLAAVLNTVLSRAAPAPRASC